MSTFSIVSPNSTVAFVASTADADNGSATCGGTRFEAMPILLPKRFLLSLRIVPMSNDWTFFFNSFRCFPAYFIIRY